MMQKRKVKRKSSTIRLKKRLGQHILKDKEILKEIVDACEILPETVVLEIGAGVANLTEVLAQQAQKVVAVEIDQQFKIYHLRMQAKYTNTEFIYEDILDLDLEKISSLKGARDLVITGNIPYNITSPLVMKILESPIKFRQMLLMMQKEVAQRLTAAPGGKNISAITLKIQYYCKASILKIVPGKVFLPPPQVDSAIARFVPRDKIPYTPEKGKFFLNFLDAAFSQRRKTILNSLGHALRKDIKKEDLRGTLQKVGIDPVQRPETISLEKYQNLYNLISRDYDILQKNT
jgi:16S rRNA (adenine1518-N6/adenine1519-N6)-dimethyltransferase